MITQKMLFIDAHCHPNMPEFAEDADEAIARAAKLGVAMIVVGTGKETSAKAVELASRFPNVWAIVGLHPIHAHEELSEAAGAGADSTGVGEFDYEFYKKLALHERVVGIGECGFDYFRVSSDTRASQEKAFVGQIALANEVNKPLMLHMRSGKGAGASASDSSGVGAGADANIHVDAYKDTLHFLKHGPVPVKVKGDAHFFAGGVEYAKQFLDHGFYISLTGVITFSQDYDEVAKYVPLDRLLSETDAPFVAPAPYRGQRNEPAYVVEIAKKLAEIRGVTEADTPAFYAQLLKNAETLFGIKF